MGLKDFKIKVSKENILHNYHYLKKFRNKDIIAVVKANAYGHGLENIVKFLSENGCEYFAVARECEAEKILSLKIKDIKIIILETVDELEILKNNENIHMVVNSFNELLNLLDKGVSTEQLHIKLDFGFGRNGILEKDFFKLKELIENRNLKFKGLCTHVFAADYDDLISIEERFSKILKELGKGRFEIVHMQNSAGVMSVEGKFCTHIRCGTVLFGLQEIGYYIPSIKRSFRLDGKILDIKSIGDLKYIGYEKKENLNIGKYKKIAKIRLGYGDGFSKRSEGIMSIINNKKFEIIHISMDSSFILVDDSVKVGDEVEIFHDLEESINHLKVPHYEFLSCINDRIKRELI